MIAFMTALAAIALAGIGWTLVDWFRDGYRRVRTLDADRRTPVRDLAHRVAARS